MDRSIVLMGIVWIIYLFILMPLYQIKETFGGLVGALHYKLSLSAVFFAVGIAGVLTHPYGLFYLLTAVGMAFAVSGDCFLAYVGKNRRRFLLGVLSFGFTQLFYIAAMAVRSGLSWPEFAVTAGLLLAAALSAALLKMNAGKMLAPLSFYSALVAFMAVKSVTMLFSQGALALQGLFAAGAVLFLLSDICLGIHYFVSAKKPFPILVAVFYFTGQLMIATAVFFET